MTENNRNTSRNWSSVTLSTTNPTWTVPAVDRGLRDVKPAAIMASNEL
jgi:hypothetical protein